VTLSGEAITISLGSLGALVTAVARWGLQVNYRLTRLETKYDAMAEKIDDVKDEVRDGNEKLDRLIDKLL
jgi:formiminotetrahydrofolate cyclodeaminase